MNEHNGVLLATVFTIPGGADKGWSNKKEKNIYIFNGYQLVGRWVWPVMKQEQAQQQQGAKAAARVLDSSLTIGTKK